MKAICAIVEYANDYQHLQRDRRQQDQHEDAASVGDAGVERCPDRRRRFHHFVSQPCSGNCADLSSAAKTRSTRDGVDRARNHSGGAHRLSADEKDRIVEAAEHLVEQRHPRDQTEIADAADEELFARREHRR